MIFPKNDYLTFSVEKGTPVVFTFPTKKPKKIWLDVSTLNASFRMRINDEETGMLIHMNTTSQKSFKIPSTVNSITITTTVETPFNMTLLVEEWDN